LFVYLHKKFGSENMHFLIVLIPMIHTLGVVVTGIHRHQVAIVIIGSVVI
jgi:hypothetical protein